MSDYDELLIAAALTVIAAPIWIPVWAIWYVFGGYKYDKVETQPTHNIPQSAPKTTPKVFTSIAQKKKYSK